MNSRAHFSLIARCGAAIGGSLLGSSLAIETQRRKEQLYIKKLPGSLWTLQPGQPFVNPTMAPTHREFLARLSKLQHVDFREPFNITYPIAFLRLSDPALKPVLESAKRDDRAHHVFAGGITALIAAIYAQRHGVSDVVYISTGNMASSFSGHQKHLQKTESIFPMYIPQSGNYHLVPLATNWIRKRFDPTYMPNQYNYSLADVDVRSLKKEDLRTIICYALNDLNPYKKQALIQSITALGADYQRSWDSLASLLHKEEVVTDSFQSMLNGGRRKVTFGTDDTLEAKKEWDALNITDSYIPAPVEIKNKYTSQVTPFTIISDGGFPPDLHDSLFKLAEKSGVRCVNEQITHHVYSDTPPYISESIVTRSVTHEVTIYPTGETGSVFVNYGAKTHPTGPLANKIPHTTTAGGISAIYAIVSDRPLDTFSSTSAGEHLTLLETTQRSDGRYQSYLQVTGAGFITGNPTHIPKDLLLHLQESMLHLYNLKLSQVTLLTCRVCLRPTDGDNHVKVTRISPNEVAVTGAGGTGLSVAPWAAEEGLRQLNISKSSPVNPYA